MSEPGSQNVEKTVAKHNLVADVQVAHRVVVLRVADVAVGLDLAAVEPVGDLVGDRRQRAQLAALLGLEAQPARAGALLEGLGVVVLEGRGDGVPERLEAGEHGVAQPRYHRCGDVACVSSRSRRQNRRHDFDSFSVLTPTALPTPRIFRASGHSPSSCSLR